MRLILSVSVGFLFLLLGSCSKDKIVKTRYYSYELNPAYNGNHPTTGLTANVYVKDVSIALEFLCDMTGSLDSNTYTLRIHEYDASAQYGYNPIATYDLGSIVNNTPKNTSISSTDFASFTEDFKGYFIIQDPKNPSNDTSTLLIFGKIGSEW